MTKEITKAIILQEMQDKLKLREFDPANFLFDETVVPVYNIEQHLTLPRTGKRTKSITGIGGEIFFTIPDNERWNLNGYTVTFLGAGAHTVSGVYVIRRYHDSGSFCYLDLKAGQSASYTINLPKPLILSFGDTVGIMIDGYTSTQNLDLNIDYLKEEVR